MSAYYNDNDRNNAAWLRELIADGLIAPGEVDQRSIVDVRPEDVKGFIQCHFFAGVGGWSTALRLAGWPDDLPVWTGSCPCQPISSAGKRRGHADQRHLWPAFYRLIAERRPSVVFGEQVGGTDGREWLAGVRADLEDAGYACGAADLPAASVGSPQIRQRIFWMAHARPISGERRQDEQRPFVADAREWIQETTDDQRGGATGWLGHAASIGNRTKQDAGSNRQSEIEGRCGGAGGSGSLGGVANAECDAGKSRGITEQCKQGDGESQGGASIESGRCSGLGFWSDFALIPCADGKARRVKSGSFPLVDGLPAGMGRRRDPGTPINTENSAEARVMRLRGYGNAIVPQVAARFIRAAMEAT